MKSLLSPGRLTELLGEPLLTVPEVAAHLRIHRSHLYRLAGVPGGIPCLRVGTTIRFRAKDIREYEERCLMAGGVGMRGDRVAEGPEGSTPGPGRRSGWTPPSE